MLKFYCASNISVRSTLSCEKGRIWIRIREAQKHADHADPDPQHCFKCCRTELSRILNIVEENWEGEGAWTSIMCKPNRNKKQDRKWRRNVYFPTILDNGHNKTVHKDQLGTVATCTSKKSVGEGVRERFLHPVLKTRWERQHCTATWS